MVERAVDCYRTAAESEATEVAAVAWRRLSNIFRGHGQWEEALEAAHRGASLARRSGDPELVAEALNAQALVNVSRGEYRAARALLEDAADLAKRDRTLGVTFESLGHVAARTGDLDAAERYLHAAAGHFRLAQHHWGEACVLTSFAELALQREQWRAAAALARRACASAREVEDLNLLALATKHHAEAKAALGDLEEAEDLVSQALGYFMSSGNMLSQLETYRLFGDISVARGDRERARSCYLKAMDLATRLQSRQEETNLTARLGNIGADAGRRLSDTS